MSAPADGAMIETGCPFTGPISLRCSAETGTEISRLLMENIEPTEALPFTTWPTSSWVSRIRASKGARTRVRLSDSSAACCAAWPLWIRALAAAICAQLARGASLETAVKRGRHFTSEAIARAAHWRLGQGHGPVWQIA